MISKPIFLIDSNVLLDIIANQPNQHTKWSINVLAACAMEGDLAVNQIIYAEIATNFPDLLDLESAMTDYHKLSLPREAAYIASKAYAKYKKNGGARHTITPDFYIGAHATYSRLTLVTRDRGYKNYFSHLKLITPH